MKRHPKAIAALKAESEISERVAAIAEKHGLTDIELLQILNGLQATTLKYMLRFERHPHNPDLPADVE